MAPAMARATVRARRTVAVGAARVGIATGAITSTRDTDLAADSNDHSDPYTPQQVRSDPFVEPLN